MAKSYTVTGRVKVFPQKGGWMYVRVPRRITAETKSLADRGLVAVRATVGAFSWDTSLLPMGDGTQFIALPAKVRKAEAIELGSRVTVRVQLRRR